MGITTERISHSNGQTYYRVKIKAFKDKMMSWKPGRLVRLKEITVNGVPLRLQVYPNGDNKANSGYVSYYVENNASYDIELDYDLRIKNEKLEMNNFPIPAGTNWGHEKYFDHDDLVRCGYCEDEEEEDKELEIHWIIKNVWKDVDYDGFKINDLSAKIDIIDNDTRNISANAEENYQKLSKKCDKSTAMIKTLQENMKKLELEMKQINRKRIPLPECPVCFNEMGPDVRIGQCPSGHLLCWTCKERMSSPQQTAICPSCKAPVTHRAYGMENYIKTLFQ